MNVDQQSQIVRTTDGRTSGDGMENEDLVTAETPSDKEEKIVLKTDVATATKQPQSSKKPVNIVHPPVKIIDILSKNSVLHGDKPNRPTGETLRPIRGRNLMYRPQLENNCCLPAVVPKGKVYHLIPKLIQREKPKSLKDKQPRFVPFEPYKAAVNPIFHSKRQNLVKLNKNHLDINILVSQMSNMKTNELNCGTSENDSTVQSEKSETEKEIEDLKRERDYYQNQLKFQAQVNAELKNLLVASVGEDLQTKVNVLTEDKLQLARALLDSANHLSSHTEQIEYLAGQCEVWRSKFLASSVMIEELARWKADLTQKNKSLIDSNKRMLQLISQVRDIEIDVLKNLTFIAGLKTLSLPSSNLISLGAECLNISQQLVLHSGIGVPENLHLKHLEHQTDAEKLSIQAIECNSQPLMETDEAFKAIVCQAHSSINVSVSGSEIKK